MLGVTPPITLESSASVNTQLDRGTAARAPTDATEIERRRDGLRPGIFRRNLDGYLGRTSRDMLKLVCSQFPVCRFVHIRLAKGS
jgi:hypothetical protein